MELTFKMNEPFFGRTITALITPFDKDNNLDIPALHTLIERQLEAGIDALVVGASTGEAATLSHEEKLTLFKEVKEQVQGKMQVIAYVGSNNTAASVEFAKEVDALELDGYLVVVPYYNKPPQEGIYQHFKHIADACKTPIMLYNIPGRCVINMDADTTLRLARDCKNIVAIKEASSNMEQIQQIIDGAPEDFFVYSGEDGDTLELMRRGGAGVVSTTSNVCPKAMNDMVLAQANGDEKKAQDIEMELKDLMKGLFITSNPIMVKDALRQLNVCSGAPRLPLIAANKDQSGQLAEILNNCKVLA